jgi:hypothetical protein
VASFQDADASCAAGDYTATINWGDGSGSTGTVSPSSGACAFDVSGNHTYVVPGSYTVVATVTDAGGSSTSATGGMTVATPVTTSKASVSASNNTNGYVLGLSASVKNSVVSGSMRYDVPTATNPTTHITSTQVTSIVRTGANTATVYGTGTQNGVTVNFAADVFGNQRSGNTFRVRTSALYDSGVLPVSSAKVS